MRGQLGSWVREQVQIVIRGSDQGGPIQGPTTDVGKFEQNPLLIRPGKPVHGYPEHAQKVPPRRYLNGLQESSRTPSVAERRPGNYCSFAYSALACFSMGMSGSASFHSVRKS